MHTILGGNITFHFAWYFKIYCTFTVITFDVYLMPRESAVYDITTLLCLWLDNYDCKTSLYTFLWRLHIQSVSWPALVHMKSLSEHLRNFL